jgi:predicted transcriptional regulator of viral defense system
VDNFIRAKRLLEAAGSARARDLNALGLASAQLGRLVERGLLIRLSRGIYALADREPSEHEALRVVTQRAPHVFFCLITALRFHGLTTQAPHEVWIGLGANRNPPPLEWPRLRVIRYSGIGLTEGVESYNREGISLRLTDIPRTIVDCFKFRNRIGLDVALEALSQARRERRMTYDELWRMAGKLRMANVMRPYLEAVR